MKLSAKLPNKSAMAIAYSGGGDSTALVHMMRYYEPAPVILIVDHGLRLGSDVEAKQAKRFAEALGLKTKILKWQHDNPSTGLQEKARKARYKLLGDACRKLGIKYLLTGHTLDDQAETILMRYDRNTDWRGAAGMASNAYAPLWPELAEIRLIRPLIHSSRDALRTYNKKHELSWIEDPSNQNRQFTRIKARDYLSKNPDLKHDLLTTAQQLRQDLKTEARLFRHFVNAHVTIDQWGIVSTDTVPPPRLLGLLLRIAAGTGGPISQAALTTLRREMLARNVNAGTLAGAYMIFEDGRFLIGPDPQTYKGRKGKPAIALEKWPKYQKKIWHGRYNINCRDNDINVRPLYGHMSKLSQSQQRELKRLPPPFRGNLPLILNTDDQVYGCPGAALHPDIDIECLVAPRLQEILKVTDV